MKINLTGSIAAELLAEALEAGALAQGDDFAGFRDGKPA